MTRFKNKEEALDVAKKYTKRNEGSWIEIRAVYCGKKSPPPHIAVIDGWAASWSVYGVEK